MSYGINYTKEIDIEQALDHAKQYLRTSAIVCIDEMENSRIVVLNSQHFNNDRFKYSIKKLLIGPIKKGIDKFLLIKSYQIWED